VRLARLPLLTADCLAPPPCHCRAAILAASAPAARAAAISNSNVVAKASLPVAVSGRPPTADRLPDRRPRTPIRADLPEILNDEVMEKSVEIPKILPFH